MAKMTLKLPDDLADRLSDLQKRSDTLVKKALEEGGKVVLKQAQSNLNSVVGKGTKYDSRATGELERSLGLSPVKENGAGRDIKVGFSEPHSGGVSNAMLAPLLEYGKHGQAAKPFMTPAKRSAQKLCIEAMRKIFEEGVDSL
ncbi:MAG: HK97 gp10 family phage protein [Clostridiales bacterium]|nr:HK97 gp10 family phage protein [Clostridiales bacterium]